MEQTVSLKVKIIFTITFAFLTALGANCFFYLPFTPVPLTMQVFTVLLSSLILGMPYAFYSQLMYVGLGFMGMGVFAGFNNSYTVLAGPTAGYVLGFLAASFVSSYIFKNISSPKRVWWALMAGLLCIYSLGYIHILFYVNKSIAFSSAEAANVFKLAVLPFIVPDIIKILLAANIYKVLSGKGKNQDE